jgi:O-antigen ligase
MDARVQNDRVPSIPPWLLTAGALGLAAVLGRLMAGGHMKYGVAIVLAACYVPLVFFDLAAALAVWVTVLFFQDLSFLSSGPNAIGVLVALGWIGAFLGRRGHLPVLGANRKLFISIVLFCMWSTLTISWSGHPGPAAQEAGYFWLAALAFLVVTTTLTNMRDVRFVVLAFVIGAVISVLIGLGTGSLKASETAVSQTAVQGRFTGGGGDPNLTAAGLVAALFLIIGLFSIYRSWRARRLLLIAFTLVTIGFIATQSRGGLVALLVAALLTFVLAPRQRRRILALMGLVGVATAVLLAVRPDALQRILDLSGGTTGRSDLWSVAWKVFTSHPLAGVGSGNFRLIEQHYVLLPGTINRIDLLTTVPHLVHNTYLQLLAESGVIGLAAFLVVIVGCLRSMWLAIKEFEARGLSNYADLARTVMMGTIGMLTAIFFISDVDDLRLWVLFGLGPVLLVLARQAPTVGRLAPR